MGWSRHASHAAIFLSKHFFDGIGLELPLANLHQRSDNSPAHFIQEPIALDDKCQEGAGPANIAARQSPDCALRFVVAVSGKGFEVVLPDEVPSGSPHR